MSLLSHVMAMGGNHQHRSALSDQVPSPVRIGQSGNHITLFNDYLERTLTTEKGCLRTYSFTNKLSHQTYSLSGPEFEIQLIDDEMSAINPLILTTQDFTVIDHSIDEEPDGGRTITFHTESRQRDSVHLQVAVSYELKPRDHYTRQWIEVKSTEKMLTEKSLFIHYIVVFENSWNSVAAFELGGLGQPLFGQDIFVGLEYPSGINEAKGGEAKVGSYVGLETSREGFVSPSAVLGVTLPHRVHDGFMTYINRIRALPPRPYIEYNNFYDVPGTRQNTQNTLELVAELQTHLLSPYSLHLGTFTLDDSWDDADNLWAIDEKRFPNGFRDIVNALAGLDSHLGLWLSPMGGYGPEKDYPLNDRRHRAAAGDRIGLEVNSTTKYFCIAGEAYSRYLQRTIVGLISRYEANYFKFDGIPLACNQLNHGHPVGIYSREAAVRNVIALTKAMRAVDPHVFIDFATGPWLSPWWLVYADSVDYGGQDYAHLETIPSPTPRQSAISYRDSVAYQDLVVARDQFPISSLGSTGIIKERDLLGGKEESIDDWNDEVVNYIGAGIRFADLMLSPTGSSNELLKPQEWDSLGRTLQYMVRNEHPLLDNGKLVLGDPARREPYGYVHHSPNKTIILLRNPSVRPARVNLALNEENGFEPTQVKLWADIVYPFRQSLPGVYSYGGTLDVSLDGYEQQVVELSPVREDAARIEGVRLSQVSSQDADVSYTVYSAHDSETIVYVPNSLLYSEARVDSKEATLRATGAKSQGQIVIPFGTKESRESQASCQSSPIQSDGKSSSVHFLDIFVSCLIPSDFHQSEIALLLESADSFGDIAAAVVLDSKTVPAVFERSNMWYWVTVTLTPGRHSVECKLRFPSGLPSNMQVTGWLRTRRLLEEKQLHLILHPGATVRPLEKDLLPCSSQLERKTYVLFDQRIR